MAKDPILINHIMNEILYRFPFMKDVFAEMEKQGYDFPEKVFSKYMTLYQQNYTSEPIMEYGETYNFFKTVGKIFKSHKKNKDHFIQGENSFWFAVTDKRSKGPTSNFIGKMEDDFGRRLYPTKDDIYIFSLATRLSYDEFLNLIKDAKLDCGDPTRYAFNTGNLRDALILSVIKDIDMWYDHIARKTETTPLDLHFVMELLLDVDKLLWENLCKGKETAHLENLLYHSFLIDRGGNAYTGFCKKHFKEADDFITFQKEAREALRKERDESYDAERTKHKKSKNISSLL